jgi:hypothetical protein
MFVPIDNKKIDELKKKLEEDERKRKMIEDEKARISQEITAQLLNDFEKNEDVRRIKYASPDYTEQKPVDPKKKKASEKVENKPVEIPVVIVPDIPNSPTPTPTQTQTPINDPRLTLQNHLTRLTHQELLLQALPPQFFLNLTILIHYHKSNLNFTRLSTQQNQVQFTTQKLSQFMYQSPSLLKDLQSILIPIHLCQDLVTTRDNLILLMKEKR